MTSKKTYQNYQIASVLFFVSSIICLCCGFYFVCVLQGIAALLLFLYANWIKTDQNTSREYDEFVYSKTIKHGMTIDQVKEELKGQPFVTDHTISALENGICPTCGGKVVNGKCQYCGNVYSDDSDVLVLSYNCKYGTKAYTFKNGILDKIYTHANPINNFLILN